MGRLEAEENLSVTNEAQPSEPSQQRELRLTLDFAKSEISELRLALCQNQWFADSEKSDKIRRILESTNGLPPPLINSLEEDLEVFSIMEEMVTEIIEEALKTEEKNQVVGNLQQVQNLTTPQKRKRETDREDNKSPEEDNLRKPGSTKKIRSRNNQPASLHPPTPVQTFLQKFNFKILKAPAVQKPPTSKLQVAHPTQIPTTPQPISEKKNFLSKLSQAKSKFETKSTSKIKRNKCEAPKRRLESTRNIKLATTPTTPTCQKPQPNLALPRNILLPEMALPRNIPLQQEPRKISTTKCDKN